MALHRLMTLDATLFSRKSVVVPSAGPVAGATAGLATATAAAVAATGAIVGSAVRSPASGPRLEAPGAPPVALTISVDRERDAHGERLGG